MVLNTDFQAAVTNILDKEIEALETVLVSLQTEHDALEARDAEALTTASQHKLHCIEAAGKVAAERATLLTGSADITGNDRLSLRWEKLVKLAKSCKEKNDVNGMLIRWQHRYIEQTLAVLRADNSDAKLYGPDGANERSNNKRRGSIGLA